MKKLTIIADNNIAYVSHYFSSQSLAIDIDLICLAGREITPEIIKKFQPDALLVRSITQVNKELLQDNHSLRFVGSATIGTDHIDQDYLAKRGIFFTNATGCSKHSVAQYVITAILQLQPTYQRQNTSLGISLGIIGLGNIGSSLVEYAKDLGWQVLAYDPFIADKQPINNTQSNENNNESNNVSNNESNNKSNNVKWVSLEELLTQADVISLHVPLTTEQESPYPTYHLIDEQALSLMKSDCLLINSARGQVIKESALLADINKTNRHVVLDVFEYEPIVSDKLLAKLAIATPHIAGYTLEGKLRGTDMIYQIFCDYFNLPIKQAINNQAIIQLLPENTLHWQELLMTEIHKSEQLNNFYNIMQDDKDLRNLISYDQATDSNQVIATDFDTLRKHYRLRREWKK